MDCIVSKDLRIVNCSSDVLKYYKQKLTLSNPEYVKKQRMGFWVGNTPKTIALYKVEGNDLILPYGEILTIKNVIPDVNLIPKYTVLPKKPTGYSVELFDYQEVAVKQILKKPCGILKAPPASGKTQMGIAIANSIGQKTLWLTHTADLLKQSYDRAKRYLPENLLGTITEGKVNIGEFMTFATIQTMVNMDLQEVRDKWQIVIVDECHRVCGSPSKATQFSKVLNALASPRKYGLSATVHRSDGLIQCCYSLLGNVTYEVPPEEVEDRTMTVDIVEVLTGVKASYECLNPDGTLNHSKLIGSLVEDTFRNEIIADLANKSTGSVLILSDRVGHLEALNALIDNSVIVSGKQTGKKGRAERAQSLDDVREGKIKVLLATYSLAKEGLDIPCLENLILATPHKDYAVITQSIGRVARVNEGKEKAVCYDLVDDIRYCNSSWKKRVSVYKQSKVRFKEVVDYGMGAD